MMQYQVVKAVNIDLNVAIRSLEFQVTELIKNGWEPTGGVTIAQNYTTNGLVVNKVIQAMIKR